MWGLFVGALLAEFGPDLLLFALAVGLAIDWKTPGVPKLAAGLFGAIVLLRLMAGAPGGYALAFAVGLAVGGFFGWCRSMFLKIEKAGASAVEKFSEQAGL